MSALPSQLTLVRVDRVPVALVGVESTETRPTKPRMILRAIGRQVRALVVAQRSLHGQVGSSALGGRGRLPAVFEPVSLGLDDRRRGSGTLAQASALVSGDDERAAFAAPRVHPLLGRGHPLQAPKAGVEEVLVAELLLGQVMVAVDHLARPRSNRLRSW